MSKIYTRNGDQGKTTRLDGEIVYKNDVIISLNGLIDECNSIIGITRSSIENDKIDKILKKIQEKLFVAGLEVSSRGQYKKIKFICKKDVQEVEKIIDNIECDLKPLSNFILPSGGKSSAHLHYTRSMIRKLERKLLNLEYNWLSKSFLISYFNRLSDMFFVLARYESHINGHSDEIWKSTS